MKNKININTDGVNVYVDLKVVSNLMGRVLLGLMILALVVLSVWAVLSAEGFPIGFYLVVALTMFFAVKYFLWNVYGEESIVINTKSINYSYSYGFLQTNLKTITFHHLGTGYEKIKMGGGQTELGKLLFYNFNKENNLPELIFESTVLVPKEQIAIMDQWIKDLFLSELYGDMRFIPYSLN